MDEIKEGLESRRTVFVTVGTTSFDSLVKAVDTQEVKDQLSRKGYTHLLIQMGRGAYIPKKVIQIHAILMLLLHCVISY